MKKLLLLVVLFNGFLTSAQTPVHQWSKSFGGEGNETIGNTVVDAQGNVFSCGIFKGTKDFDPSEATFNLTAIGRNFDIFITKLNANGDFQWAYKFGAFFPEEYCNVTLDNSGNVFLTGSMAGTIDFDPGVGVENLTPTAALPNTFVLKLTNNGIFTWVKQFAGGENYPSFIKTDSNGNVILTGKHFFTVDFEPSISTFPITTDAAGGIYFVKLNSNGDFIWAKSLNDITQINDLQIDVANNIYTLGNFIGTRDFDASTAVFNLTAPTRGMFVLKNSSAGDFIWAKAIECSNPISPESLAVDSNTNVFLAGSFEGIADFDPSAAVYNLTTNYDSTFGHQKHTFVEKLNSDGSFAWVNRTGQLLNPIDSGFDLNYNAGFIQSGEMVLDSAGNVLLSGMFQGNMTFGNINITSALCQNCANSQYPKSTDIFLTKIDTNGNNLWVQNYSTYKQNAINTMELFDLTIDTSSNLYLHGYSFFSVDFDFYVTGNELFISEQRMFITKFGIQTLAKSQNFLTNNNLQLYPNPTSGNFNISIDENLIGSKVSIHNILGQKVKEFKLDGLTTNQNLDKGLYMLEIEKQDNKISKKLIVN